MPTLSLIHPWPAQMRADRPTDDDHVADVAVRGCRPVAELYSEALAQHGIPNGISELRIFHSHDPDAGRVLATALVDAPPEGPEFGFIRVPTAFVARPPQARALTLLEAVHGVAMRFAAPRGWDVDALEACRQHVLDQGLEYRWSAAPKTSPDRRHRARADFRLLPDGYGRVRLTVMRSDDGSVVATTEEALAYCTSQSFRRAAKSMRWQGKDRVSLVPYDAVPAIRGGEVSLTCEEDGWRGTAVDYMSVRPVPPGDPALPPLAVHVEGRGATAAEQPARISFGGGGPIQSRLIQRFHDLFGAEMARVASPAGQDWWQDAGSTLLDVEIEYMRERVEVRGRRTDQLLRIFVTVSDAALEAREGELEPLAREVALDVVALVRRRTGLGPHPDLTSP